MRAVKIPWFHSSAKAPRSPIPASLPLFLSHPRAHLPADARSGSRRALLFPAIPSYSHAIPTHVSSPISLPAGCTGAGQDQDHAGTLNWHQQPLSPTGEQPGVTSAPGRGVQIPHSPDSLQRSHIYAQGDPPGISGSLVPQHQVPRADSGFGLPPAVFQ